MSTVTRTNLGEYSSIVCFKAVITGMEEALGEKATAIALIAAGRTRGKTLVTSLGLAGSSLPIDEVAIQLNAAVGKQGTRLTTINKIEKDGDIFRVYCSEAVCSAGEEMGSSRKCTFTLGAIWGALEAVLDHRLQGVHTESVLRGSAYDVFEFKTLG